jgi:hypothetical protein
MHKLNGNKALLIVFALFLVSVSVRVPGLNKPLSGHHESISATELISIESWEQLGGPRATYFIPLHNYQNPGDRRIPNNVFIDDKGNYTYISYGTGWNALPYFIFKLFRIKPSPIALRIFNMVIGFISCFILFGLMLHYGNKQNLYPGAIIACATFIFTPGILWYTGNVYVNGSVAIPFILLFLLVIAAIIANPRVKMFRNCVVLFLVILCLLWIDWVIVFLVFTSLLVLLFLIRGRRLLFYPVITLVVATCSGLGLILYQFGSYLGWAMVKNNLTEKFGYRSIDASGGIIKPVAALATHFTTAFMPVVILLIISFVMIRKRRVKPRIGKILKLIFLIFLPALLLYNITFLSWSAIHEFSILYYGILFAIAAGLIIPQVLPLYRFKVVMGLFILITVAEYYYINPPGMKSFKGELYNSYKNLGESVAQQVKPNQAVFINMELLPPVMYYAKRSISFASTEEKAKALLSEFQTNEGVWIEQKGFKITAVKYFKK